MPFHVNSNLNICFLQYNLIANGVVYVNQSIAIHYEYDTFVTAILKVNWRWPTSIDKYNTVYGKVGVETLYRDWHRKSKLGMNLVPGQRVF
jgi:hypothetical protein